MFLIFTVPDIYFYLCFEFGKAFRLSEARGDGLPSGYRLANAC